jgi:hypothetical protein
MIKKIFITIVIIFFLIMGILINSRFVATKGLITKEYTIINSNLPLGFDGMKILHFSDILYNSNTNQKDIDKIVEECNLIKPDIIIFSGDLVGKNYKLTAKDKQYLITLLKKLDSSYGKYAIIGDNDYNDLVTVKDIYLNSDFNILDNDYDIIYDDDGESIFLGGIASSIEKQADGDAVMNYFNNNKDIDYKIIVLHEPDYIDEIIPKYDINLILGGHSLNGQVNIPLIKNILLQQEAYKYYNNYYKINDTDIFISSGIGVARTNFRFNNKPSINFYRFRIE